MNTEFWATELTQMKRAMDDNVAVPVGGFDPGAGSHADPSYQGVPPENAPAVPGAMQRAQQFGSRNVADVRRSIVGANPAMAYGGGMAAGGALGAGIGALTGSGEEVDEQGNVITPGTRGRNALIGGALGAGLGAGAIAAARRGLMPAGTPTWHDGGYQSQPVG